MRKILTLIALCVVITFTGVCAWAVPFSSLYAFGDSLSDGGNNSSSVISVYKLGGGSCDSHFPCPPYVEGHFSNGAVAVEYLADSILAGGATPTNFFNFSVAGATSGTGNFGDSGAATSSGTSKLLSMQQEIKLHLARSGGLADPNALYFMWGGANDFLTLNSPIQAARNIAGYVGELITAGAEHFLVPNLPDLGLIPRARIEDIEDAAHLFSASFNIELASQLDDLSVLFPAVDIIQYDVFTFSSNVIQNPANYGFDNAQDACFLVGCSDPDNYIFWDNLHPTTKVHAIFAAVFANALPIPSPGTISLFAIGFLMFGFSRKTEPTSSPPLSSGRILSKRI